MRIALVCLIIFWSLSVIGCGGETQVTKTSENKPRATGMLTDKQIRVEQVQMVSAPLEQTVVPGKIETNPGGLSKVALPLAGRVSRVLVGIGDTVRRGDALLVLDSPDTGTAVSNYRQAIAKVLQAKSSVAKAEADLSRAQDLYSHGAVAEKDVLSAKAQLTQAQSDLAQANASQEEAVRKMKIFGIDASGKNDQIYVPAPVSGKVLDLSVVAGEYRNDVSAPVMTIADLSSVFMTADVPETSIRLVQPHEETETTLDAYPGEVFVGRVARIADTVDPTTRTVRVRVILKNATEKFRPEMFGELRITGTIQNVISVPASAVVQTASNQIVYRERAAGTYDPVPVTTGQKMGDRIAVLSGLSAGNRIVVDGPMLIRSNAQ